MGSVMGTHLSCLLNTGKGGLVIVKVSYNSRIEETGEGCDSVMNAVMNSERELVTLRMWAVGRTKLSSRLDLTVDFPSPAQLAGQMHIGFGMIFAD